ncbi:GNAT family N-acetyltransferase [Falsirhodobacter sp. 20TX0035]|uniref:GNAT family N-acetyltransferase n=1 Tax=Falsirhodobacter sp. 20TX0035 TaxID=3022019 RepID=UPI00232A98C7|nr:GNAT family N-acyltransferase [Falsirhodobacter sp. 20TX0035]MDB6453288.1 GNAT family N-acetyltransferase [Falsirhodobacter sp. 20TX0035]
MNTDPHLTLRLARDDRDLMAAQRLRYRVFIQELGGDGNLVDHDRRLERDRFDPFFDHLILVDERRDAATLDDVIGVYRLLPGDKAGAAGGFYSEGEYDLDPLRRTGRRLVELGRSCVDAEHRGGMAMMYLWNGLSEYVLERGIEILFGPASFHGTDTARLAQALSFLHHHHLAPPELRVTAREASCQPMDLLAADQVDRKAALQDIPPLIKAYLRLGGCVGDGAWIDHAFNTTDVCLVMDTAQMASKYKDFYGRKVTGHDLAGR